MLATRGPSEMLILLFSVNTRYYQHWHYPYWLAKVEKKSSPGPGFLTGLIIIYIMSSRSFIEYWDYDDRPLVCTVKHQVKSGQYKLWMHGILHLQLPIIHQGPLSLVEVGLLLLTRF